MQLESMKRMRPKQMSEAEKLINYKIIQSMNHKVNFTKNPRYQISKAPMTIQNLPQGIQDSKVFTASPPSISFQDYVAEHIYAIPLTLTNRSKRFQRVRIIPPRTEQFSITDIVYPNPSSAPGMSVHLQVNFNASSLQDFEDIIQIITEEDCLNIVVQAWKEQPNLNINSLLVCPSTFLGDSSNQIFKVTNKGGGAGFKMFCENTIQEKEGILTMKHFSISPSEFYLQKNQSINMQVIFHPKKEGQLEEQFTLACDNLTNAVYTLQGIANIIEFELLGLDNKVFSNANQLQSICFENGVLNHIVSRTLQIRNLTSVTVSYHWDIYKHLEETFEIKEPEKHFWIEPQSGQFTPHSTLSFTIFFLAIEQVLFQKRFHISIIWH